METDLRINGGYFLFRREIFDYMRPGEELVEEPFDRLIAANELLTYPHDGFTATMDTFKDKQHFDELYSKGRAPWEVWRKDVQLPEGVAVMWTPALAGDAAQEAKAGRALQRRRRLLESYSCATDRSAGRLALKLAFVTKLSPLPSGTPR